MSVAGGTGGGGGMMKELICSLVSSREEPVRFGGGTATLARKESRSMFKTSLLSRSRKQKNNWITLSTYIFGFLNLKIIFSW